MASRRTRSKAEIPVSMKSLLKQQEAEKFSGRKASSAKRLFDDEEEQNVGIKRKRVTSKSPDEWSPVSQAMTTMKSRLSMEKSVTSDDKTRSPIKVVSNASVNKEDIVNRYHSAMNRRSPHATMNISPRKYLNPGSPVKYLSTPSPHNVRSPTQDSPGRLPSGRKSARRQLNFSNESGGSSSPSIYSSLVIPPFDPTGTPTKMRVGKRFQQFTEKKPHDELLLPKKYQSLERLFVALESVFGYSKGKSCNFTEAKNLVEAACKLKFVPSHLEQIKTVNPNLFNFHPHVTPPPSNSETTSTRIPDNTSLFTAFSIESTVYRDCALKSIPVSSQLLKARRNDFHQRLFQRVFEAHNKFLRNSKKQLTSSPKKDISEVEKWDPAFPLNTCKYLEIPRSSLFPSKTTSSSPSPTSSSGQGDHNTSSSTGGGAKYGTDEIDKLLVGENHPEYRKIKKYQTMMNEIENTFVETKSNSKSSSANLKEKKTRGRKRKRSVVSASPEKKGSREEVGKITEELLLAPVPKALANISSLAVVKARLLEKKENEKIDRGYDMTQRRLRILSSLRLLCDMIWTYYHQQGKRIICRKQLETHLHSAKRIISVDDISLSLNLLLEMAPRLVHVKMVDNVPWIQMRKDVVALTAAKEAIHSAYVAARGELDAYQY